MDGKAWAYELNDGAPVSSSLHQAVNVGPAPEDRCCRVPFGDVTRNFSDYYAPFLDTSDLKSPDRNRRACSSRFSPNRPPGSGAAKRLLWIKGDLPPLPPPPSSHDLAAPSLSGAGAPSTERDASPTRHTLRTSSAVDACEILAPQALETLGDQDSTVLLVLRSLTIAGTHTVSKRPSLAQKGLFAAGASVALPPVSFSASDAIARPFPLPTELGSPGAAGATGRPTPTPTTAAEAEAEAENKAVPLRETDENAVSQPTDRPTGV